LEQISSTALKQQTALQCLPFSIISLPDSDGEYDPFAEKPFLLSSYNQISPNEYLSPHTHKIFTVDPQRRTKTISISSNPRPLPTEEYDRELKIFEQATNEVWNVYTQLYYGGDAVGSAYFRRSSNPTGTGGSSSTSGGGVAAAKTAGKSSDLYSIEGMFGIQKRSEDDDGIGGWDSVHLIQVDEPNPTTGTCQYRIQSAVSLSIRPISGTVISSTWQKDTVKTLKVQALSISASHLENLGKLIEEVEFGFRSKVERIDVPQSLDIIESMYQVNASDAMKYSDASAAVAKVAGSTTGMSVGSTIIEDIASEAQKKKAEGNEFLDRMKAQQDAKEAQMVEQNKEAEGRLSNTKSLLKPTTGTTDNGVSVPPLSSSSAMNSPTPEFLDFRNKLKKPAGV